MTRRISPVLLFCTVVVLAVLSLRPLTLARDEAPAMKSDARRPPQTFATTIRQPIHALVVSTGVRGASGNEIEVACAVCHAGRRADASVNSSIALTEFHTGLVYTHGSLACLACHEGSDPGQFRSASGTAIAFDEVLTLCAQCHGPQWRDYQHGAHGGMTGYWDLSRGPRERNHCVDCHDPHRPAIPRMRPDFKPRDRFLTSAEAEEMNHE